MHLVQNSNFIVTFITLAVFLQNMGVVIGDGTNFYTELAALSPSQRESLAQLKNLALPILQEDYMKEDIYLVKYLKFNNFKVQKAKEHLEESLKWREENNVEEAARNPPDYIIALERDYPTYVDGYDKEGRPICEVPFGAWQVRKAANAGIIHKLALHLMISCAEKATAKVRELQKQGKNITQYVFLANMEGFSVAEHVCPSCLPLALTLTVGNDKYFPNMTYGFWLINTPDAFASLFRLIRPIMSPSTRNAMKVFNSNKAEWRPFLKKRVDFKEISDWFGGEKERHYN